MLTAVLAAGPASAASESALSEEPVPFQVDKAPDRPQPILELGSDFLGTGVIGPGFELPTGAVWQPQLLLWGSLRTAIQTFDSGDPEGPRVSEWRNRWDIFAELEVSPTERLVVALRPIDDDGRFSGCAIEPNNAPSGQNQIRSKGCNEFWNADIQSLFVEGNLGEIFPHLGPKNSRGLDIEFSVGRQPLIFQDGFLITDDRIDAFAVTRNNINLKRTTNTRISAIWAWNKVNRANNRTDGGAMLGGIFVETDTPISTINFDNVLVWSGDDTATSLHGGLSFIQRIGKLSTAFRGLYSKVLDRASPQARTGYLLFGEINYIPVYTHNNLYLNAFVGIDQYTSAARGPATGGPLGNTGILFGAVGLANYGAPLGSDVDKSFGAALGYQMFFSGNRRQLILEIGARERFKDSGARPAAGAAARLQQAIGRRVVARVEGFVAQRKSFDPGWGARFEVLIKY